MEKPETNGHSITHHATQVLVAVQSGEVLLFAAVEARVGQVDFGHEVIVEVLLVGHRIVFLGRVHHLVLGTRVLGLVRFDGDLLGDRLFRYFREVSGGRHRRLGGRRCGRGRRGRYGRSRRFGHRRRRFGGRMELDRCRRQAVLVLVPERRGQLFDADVVGRCHVEQ